MQTIWMFVMAFYATAYGTFAVSGEEQVPGSLSAYFAPNWTRVPRQTGQSFHGCSNSNHQGALVVA